MAKEATLQVRMDAELKAQAEELYERLGTSFAEAIRIFARQSVKENAMPSMLRMDEQDIKNRIGIARGEFTVPDDIDKYNDEIEYMFGDIL